VQTPTEEETESTEQLNILKWFFNRLITYPLNLDEKWQSNNEDEMIQKLHEGYKLVQSLNHDKYLLQLQ
jgi:hypothetical protein